MAGFTRMQKGLGDFTTALLLGDQLGDTAAATTTANLWQGANARAGARKNFAQAGLYENQLNEQRALPGHLAGLSLPNGVGGDALASMMTGSGSNIAQLGDFLATMYGQDRLNSAESKFPTDPGAAAFTANLGGASIDPQFTQNAAGQTLNLLTGDTGESSLSRAHVGKLGAEAAQANAGARENDAQALAARMPTFSNGTWFDLGKGGATPHMGPAGAGGNPAAYSAQIDEVFARPQLDSSGQPIVDPMTGQQRLDIQASGLAKEQFLRWYSYNQDAYPDINRAVGVYLSILAEGGNPNAHGSAPAGGAPASSPAGSPGTPGVRVYDPATRSLR